VRNGLQGRGFEEGVLLLFKKGAFPIGHYLPTAVCTISEATHKEMVLAIDNTDFKFSAAP